MQNPNQPQGVNTQQQLNMRLMSQLLNQNNAEMLQGVNPNQQVGNGGNANQIQQKAGSNQQIPLSMMMSPQIQNRSLQQQALASALQQQQSQNQAQQGQGQGQQNSSNSVQQQQLFQQLQQQQAALASQRLAQAVQQQQQQNIQIPQLQQLQSNSTSLPQSQLQDQQLDLDLVQQLQKQSLPQSQAQSQPQSQAQGQSQPQSQTQQPMVREVWNENLESEMMVIRELAERYDHISVSTEFAGIVARPIGSFRSTKDYHYQTMRSNADLLNLIQIGITISDKDGIRPEGVPSTWQFNFKFDLENEMFNKESIDSLITTGLNFKRLNENGIDTFEFAQCLIDSGLCLLKNTTWISYHAGYDFGFLISLLLNKEMPSGESEFDDWLVRYFPNYYDIKLISNIRLFEYKRGLSLESLAEELGVIRNANLNFLQVGGQSMLTHLCFWELKRLINPNEFALCRNQIFGLSDENSLLQQPTSQQTLPQLQQLHQQQQHQQQQQQLQPLQLLLQQQQQQQANGSQLPIPSSLNQLQQMSQLQAQQLISNANNGQNNQNPGQFLNMGAPPGIGNDQKNMMYYNRAV